MAVSEVPSANPRVWLDITIDDQPAGRLVIELFADKVPRTAENFRLLCTGEKGVGRNGAKLHYKGCRFHRIFPHFIVQSGDVIANDGSQSESAYGPKFEDENFVIKHDQPGIVAMANLGRNSNGSQFFITAVKAPWLDGRHVAFGKVVEGLGIVDLIQQAGTSSGVPKQKIVINDCGEV